MPYEIEYLPRVIKEDIPALPKTVAQKVKKAIDQRLATEPLLYGKPLRFNLSGYRRLRVGDWRVIYYIERKTGIVVITAIDHRKDIYEE